MITIFNKRIIIFFFLFVVFNIYSADTTIGEKMEFMSDNIPSEIKSSSSILIIVLNGSWSGEQLRKINQLLKKYSNLKIGIVFSSDFNSNSNSIINFFEGMINNIIFVDITQVNEKFLFIAVYYALEKKNIPSIYIHYQIASICGPILAELSNKYGNHSNSQFMESGKMIAKIVYSQPLLDHIKTFRLQITIDCSNQQQGSNQNNNGNQELFARINHLLNNKNLDNTIKIVLKNNLPAAKQYANSNMKNNIDSIPFRVVEKIGWMFPLDNEWDLENDMMIIIKKHQKAPIVINRIMNVISNNPFITNSIKKELNNFINSLYKQDNKIKGLLLIGPPGIGKTYLGQELASILRIPYSVIFTQEIRDIAGVSSPYVGSDMGKIAMEFFFNCRNELVKKKKALDSMIFVLDEVDKLEKPMQTQLLSLLDRSRSFEDSFLKVPIPIKNCFFILTANREEDINPALLDRMAVVRLSGYSREEKQKLCKYILETRGKQISDSAVTFLCKYDDSPGLRQLIRNIDSVLAYLSVNNSNDVNIINKNHIVCALGQIVDKSFESNKEGSMTTFIYGSIINPYERKPAELIISPFRVSASVSPNQRYSVMILPKQNYNNANGIEHAYNTIMNLKHYFDVDIQPMYVNTDALEISSSEYEFLGATAAIVILSRLKNLGIKKDSAILASLESDGDLKTTVDILPKIVIAHNRGVSLIVVSKGDLKYLSGLGLKSIGNNKFDFIVRGDKCRNLRIVACSTLKQASDILLINKMS